jgi:hypothetical protein
MQVECIQCGAGFEVIPSRVGKAKFCGLKCRGAWRSEHFHKGNNPNWKGGTRKPKTCKHCGGKFEQGTLPLVTFQRRKFCSRACADAGGLRYSGEAHPRWNGGTRSRPSAQGDWAQRVISRDKATCRTCGAKGVELHAHHIKEYAKHPAQRWQLSNGITLCAPCHWAVHSASNVNAVNSGNPQRKDGGNPEPSAGRKLREGVTTRGRAYRRVEGQCRQCGAFVSKRKSDATGANLFCSKSCSATYNARAGKIGKRPRQ